MELRHLRYFVAVADHGGISHAAERLHIAQPAVSRQIRDLEQELGFDLLLREGRRVILTDAGRAFADRARAILRQTEQAVVDAARVARGEAGAIRVGLLETASWDGHVPLTLNRFKRQHQSIRLDIRVMSSVDQIDALLAGELDAAFAYRQEHMVEDFLDILTLRHDEVVFAASTDLAFYAEGPLPLEEIDGLPIIGFPREAAPAYYDRLFGALQGIGYNAQIVQEVMDETTMLSLVSAGVGCAFVNSAHMQRPSRQLQFRQVDGLNLPIAFLYMTGRTPGSLTQLLTKTVTEIHAKEA